jgi:hypothetical protein
VDIIRKIYNWGKVQLKKLWTWIIFLVIGGVAVANIGGIPPEELSEVQLLELIAEKQAEKLIDNNKYSNNLNLDTKKLPYDIEIIEYETSTGEIGYQVIMRREVDLGKVSSSSGQPILEKQVKSVGYGVQFEQRTWNWK